MTNEERDEYYEDPETMAAANEGEKLVHRLAAWVENFEKKNPNPAVQAQHPEYFLLKECLDIIEAMVEFIEQNEYLDETH